MIESVLPASGKKYRSQLARRARQISRLFGADHRTGYLSFFASSACSMFSTRGFSRFFESSS